jgi:hemolysin III
MVDYVVHHVRLNALALRTNAAEIVNSITHGAGLVLSTAAACLLMAHVWSTNDPWRIAGCVVFASTLVSVYAASTLSHLAQRRPWREFFRTWDQGLIFLLISGTYTPIALTYLRDGWWWLLTSGMWLVAIYGFLTKVALRHQVNHTSVVLYLILGWMPILGAPWYRGAIPGPCLAWVLGGGVIYTIGAVFLVLNNAKYHFHAIWHVLVIIASACHYLGVWYYVAS